MRGARPADRRRADQSRRRAPRSAGRPPLAHDGVQRSWLSRGWDNRAFEHKRNLLLGKRVDREPRAKLLDGFLSRQHRAPRVERGYDLPQGSRSIARGNGNAHQFVAVVDVEGPLEKSVNLIAQRAPYSAHASLVGAGRRPTRDDPHRLLDYRVALNAQANHERLIWCNVDPFDR